MIDIKAKVKAIGDHLLGGFNFETRYHEYVSNKIEEFGQECFDAGRKSAFEEAAKYCSDNCTNNNGHTLSKQLMSKASSIKG